MRSNSSINNTIVTFTDTQGNALYNYRGGKLRVRVVDLYHPYPSRLEGRVRIGGSLLVEFYEECGDERIVHVHYGDEVACVRTDMRDWKRRYKTSENLPPPIISDAAMVACDVLHEALRLVLFGKG